MSVPHGINECSPWHPFKLLVDQVLTFDVAQAPQKAVLNEGRLFHFCARLRWRRVF